MSLADLGQAISADTAGLLGNVAKAVLVFPDAPPKSYTEEEADKMEGGGALGGSLGAAAAAASAAGKAAGTLKNLAGAMGNMAKTLALGSVNMGMDEKIAAEGGGKALHVQFNPSTIQINAYGGGRAPITNHGKAGGQQASTIQYGSVEPYIEVSFTLIFDQTNIADAFLTDKFTLGVTSVVKNAATLVGDLAGKEYSVRPFVEGFLAAVRQENFRSVVFLWGEMRYEGIMNTTQCKYTLFSPSGNPVRAEVGVKLMAASTKEEKSRNYVAFWKQRYKDIIEKNQKTDTDGTYIDAGKMSNQLTGLLNL